MNALKNLCYSKMGSTILYTVHHNQEEHIKSHEAYLELAEEAKNHIFHNGVGARADSSASLFGGHFPKLPADPYT